MAWDPQRYRHDTVSDFLVRWAARDLDPLYLFSSDEERLDIDSLPTKSVSPKQGVRLAFSLDGQESQILSGLGGDVLANLWRLSTTVTVASPSKHRLTLWMVDPGVVIDKLVLSFKPLKEAYLGPPESYHR